MSSSRAERQLILLSAATAARRRILHEQAGRLVAEVDWSQLTQTLRARRLLPTLGPRILEFSVGQPSDDFAAAVEHATAAARRQAVFLQLLSLRVTAALAEAGIRCAALKGPLLAEATYGDPGRRLSSDIDLLVASDDLQAAVEVVRGLGYEAPSDHVERSGLPQLHFVLTHEQDRLPPIELHWRVHWYEQSFAGERLLPPALNPLGDWRPAPADELVALLLFYARDGFIDLRLASDLSAWWDAFGVELPRAALHEQLALYPALARVIPAATKAAEKVVGLPAAQIIGDSPRTGLRERITVRLTNPNPNSSKAQLYADTGVIDGLLMPAGGFGAFVRRNLWLPSAVLEHQARHGARRRARLPLARAAGVLGRYGLTMARLLLRPETYDWDG
jgi:Uncharacterised nucleotidyltransferase